MTASPEFRTLTMADVMLELIDPTNDPTALDTQTLDWTQVSVSGIDTRGLNRAST